MMNLIKHIFKSYKTNWLEEVFVIEDLNGGEDFNDGAKTFYEQELCEKCLYSEFYWSAFSRIQTES